MDSIRPRLPQTLTTDRLVLATPSLAHVPEMAELANNRAIHQVLSRLPYPYGQEDGRLFVETIARGPEEFAWSILFEGRYIGTVGLHFPAGQPPELGYWLGQPHWGRGYATEAGRAVVEAARLAGGSVLRALVLPGNAGSRHVLEKLGFLPIGTVTHASGTLAGQQSLLVERDLGKGGTA